MGTEQVSRSLFCDDLLELPAFDEHLEPALWVRDDPHVATTGFGNPGVAAPVDHDQVTTLDSFHRSPL